MALKDSESYILKEYRPSEGLRNLIEKFYEFEFKKNKELTVNPYFFPKYTTSLVYYKDNISGEYDLYFAGPCIKNLYLPSSVNCYYWVADFHPFVARSIFNLNVSSVVNKILKVSELPDNKDCTIFLVNFVKIKTCKSRIRFVEKYISSKAGWIKTTENDITDLIDLILASEGKIKLGEVYSNMDAGTRQFQRKFRAATGLTPKQFCRITRIRSAAGKLTEGESSHLDVMFESGYYDQSHYSKEFRELSGVTPSSFEKRHKKIKRLIR